MLKPIETSYNGYRFRSRLEARWAVFFDHLGIVWEYEKEGYDLGAAGWYLPDFWLPDHGWIEIKGTKPTDEENTKALYLCIQSRHDVYIFGSCDLYGDSCGFHFIDKDDPTIPPGIHYDGIELYTTSNGYAFGGDWGNDSWKWDIGTHGYPYLGPFLEVPGYPVRTPSRVLKAYDAARSARFEHGERGR